MGEDDKDIRITYETLYELLRREKNRGDIQELDADFIDSVKSYLVEKRSMLYKNKDQQMLFSEEEQKKTLQQITNIIIILREIYDRREKKIINLAINKSKTDSDIIDTSKLLGEEVEMYSMFVDALNLYRSKILHNMIDENMAEDVHSNVNMDNMKSEDKKKSLPDDSKPDRTGEIKSKGEEDAPSTESPATEPTSSTGADKDIIKVKFLSEVQKFIDPDLKVYGPFNPGDTAEVPVVIADVLLNKGKAEVE